MIEVALAVLLVVALAIAALVSSAAWHLLLEVGAICIAAGLLVAVPTGLVYHVVLYRRARLRGPVPERWWLRPVGLHAQLTRPDQRAVMPWFYSGAAGFLVAMLGCLLVAIGALRS